MKSFLLLLAIAIMASCSPQRRLARLLDRFPLDSITKIEYRDTTIYKDTTIYEYLPGETETVEVLVDVPYAIPDTLLLARTSLAQATASLQDNVLGLDLVQFDSLFQWKLDSALRHDIDTMIVIKTIPFPVIEKIPPKPFWRIGFLVLSGLVLIAMILLFRVRK